MRRIALSTLILCMPLAAAACAGFDPQHDDKSSLVGMGLEHENLRQSNATDDSAADAESVKDTDASKPNATVDHEITDTKPNESIEKKAAATSDTAEVDSKEKDDSESEASTNKSKPTVIPEIAGTAKANDTTKPKITKDARRVEREGISYTLPPSWRSAAAKRAALATLTPMGIANGRAIDLYFEAQLVIEKDHEAWRSAFFEELERSLKQGASLTRDANAGLVNQEGKELRQFYLHRFVPQGVLSVVLSSRGDDMTADIEHTKAFLASITLPKQSALLETIQAPLAMSFDLAEEWRAEDNNGEIILRGPWSEKGSDRIHLRWVNTTIRDHVGRSDFVRNARQEYAEQLGEAWSVTATSLEEGNGLARARIVAKPNASEKETREAWFIFAEHRIVTLILPNANDASDSVAEKLWASLKANSQRR